MVLGGDGQLLDIGRASRVVPVGLRQALNLRDGGCGDTSQNNCVELCAYHHTLMHEGWRILGNPNQALQLIRPGGTRLHLTSQPRGQPPTRRP